MTTCSYCTYPVATEIAKDVLAAFQARIEQQIEKQGYKVPEPLKDLHVEIVENYGSKLCQVCACNQYILEAIIRLREIEKDKGQSDENDFLLSTVLDLYLVTHRIAINQFAWAIIEETKQKAKAAPTFSLMPSWFIMRLQQFTYTQPINTTEKERQIIKDMRADGCSIGELAFMFDRSKSTIQEIVHH